jgi:anti-anti-sigma factor
VEPEGATCVITPDAELDIASAPQLGAQVVDSLSRGERNFVLDFAGVRIIDSAGIGVLLSAHRRVLAAGGQLVVTNPSAHVRRVFELTGVGRALRLG